MEHLRHLPPTRKRDTEAVYVCAREMCVFIDYGMHLCICVSVAQRWFIQETVLFTSCRAQTIWQAGWHPMVTSLLIAKAGATPQCCLMLIKTWSSEQTGENYGKREEILRKKCIGRQLLVVFSLIFCIWIPIAVLFFQWHCCSKCGPLQKPLQSETQNLNIMAGITHQRGQASRKRCWPTKQTNSRLHSINRRRVGGGR